MLHLKSVSVDERCLSGEYEVSHDNGKTVLTQNMTIKMSLNGQPLDVEMHITELQADTFEDAMEKMASWLERLAAGIREPRKIKAMMPVFEKDWEADRKRKEQQFREAHPMALAHAQRFMMWKDEKVVPISELCGKNKSPVFPESFVVQHDRSIYIRGIPLEWMESLLAIDAVEDISGSEIFGTVFPDDTFEISTESVQSYINKEESHASS